MKLTAPSFDLDTLAPRTFPTGYDRLRYWFTLPEYQTLREAMRAVPVMTNNEWTNAFAIALTAVKDWERARAQIDLISL